MARTLKPGLAPPQPLALEFDAVTIAAHNARIREAFDRRYTQPMSDSVNDRHSTAAKTDYVCDGLRALSVELGYIVLSEEFAFADLPPHLRTVSYPRLRQAIARLKEDLGRRKVADRPITLTTDAFIQYLTRSVPF